MTEIRVEFGIITAGGRFGSRINPPAILTVTGTATLAGSRPAVPAGATAARLSAIDGDVIFAIGANPTASTTTNGQLVSSGMPEIIPVNPGDLLSFIDGPSTVAAGGGLGNSADLTFFTARTTNGAVAVDWPGGPGLLTIFGNWGSGPTTAQLAFSSDAGTSYIDTEGATFADGVDVSLPVQYSPGKVRLTLAAAGGGTSLTAKLQSTR